jgi:cell volume regulation protein A
MPVPAPLVLLLGSALVASATEPLSLDVAEPIAVAALVAILLTGGIDIHAARVRASAGSILSLGILGTFATAGVIALFAHHVLGFDWTSAGLLGAALAPTDPAMVFAVLRGRELRTRTLLEGEAGFNDPAGIALMLGLIELATHADASFGVVVSTFVLQMGLGAVLGLAGGLLLRRLDHLALLLAGAGLLYGATALLGGSGFLAVFVAGLLHDDVRGRPAAGRLAEVAVFVALGLTVAIAELPGEAWRDGALLALATGLVARPLAVAVALALARAPARERALVAFAGLKGAVPILLGGLIVAEHIPDDDRLYGIVIVVVVLSVVVQGSLVPAVAQRLGIPMRVVEPEPWSLGVRLRDEPHGVHRLTVAAGSPADGRRIEDLDDLPESAWISFVVRSGELVQVAPDTVLHDGDEALVLGAPDDADLLREVFEGSTEG